MTDQELCTETPSTAQSADAPRKRRFEVVETTGDFRNGESMATRPCGGALSWDETLCIGCRSFFDGFLDRIHSKSHRRNSGHYKNPGHGDVLFHKYPVYTTRALPGCVALGCRLCAAVQQGLFHTENELPDEWLIANSRFDTGVSTGFICFEDPCVFTLTLGIPGRGDSASHAVDLGDNTGGKRIKTWLELCETYEQCRSRLTGDGRHVPLPTRLIALSESQGRLQCQLVETKNMANNIRYTTLSYRWGTADMLKCTRENLDSLRRCIVWEDLPKTFQDAVTTTRQLGISYIWIDALCIMQDDVQEWNYEASTMARVYSRSSLNIAAEDSVNAHGGLFRQRPRCKPFSVSHPKGGPIFLCYNEEELYEEDSVVSALSGRGWIVQELRLAPRFVHFRQNTVSWTCLELDRDELHTISRTRTRGLDPFYWVRIAQQYSLTQTTKLSDRPMALAGIAEQQCRRLNLEARDYLSGLWRPYFVAELCWLLTEPKEAQRLETGDAAPSWSWIPMHSGGFQVFSEDTRNVVTRLIAAETVPTTGPFGPISSAYARVAGPLCRCYLEDDPHEDNKAWSLVVYGVNGVRLQVCRVKMYTRGGLDVYFDSTATWSTCATSPIYLLLCTVRGGHFDEEANVQWRKRDRQRFWKRVGAYNFLILRPTDTQGHFSRLGVAILFPHLQPEKQDLNSTCTTTLDRQFRRNALEPHLYHEVDEDFMYTITLV